MVLFGDSGFEFVMWQFVKYLIWVVGLCKVKWVKGKIVSFLVLCDELLLLLVEDFFFMCKLCQVFFEVCIELYIVVQSGYWEFFVLMVVVGLGMMFLLQLLVVNFVNCDKLVVVCLIVFDMDWVFVYLWLLGWYLFYVVCVWFVMCEEVLGV